jgi:hypothetical protein
MNKSYISSHYILKESPIMFATLLKPYRNYEKWAGLSTQGRLHQQPRKDPVNRLMWHINGMIFKHILLNTKIVY